MLGLSFYTSGGSYIAWLLASVTTLLSSTILLCIGGTFWPLFFFANHLNSLFYCLSLLLLHSLSEMFDTCLYSKFQIVGYLCFISL